MHLPLTLGGAVEPEDLVRDLQSLLPPSIPAHQESVAWHRGFAEAQLGKPLARTEDYARGYIEGMAISYRRFSLPDYTE